MKIDIYIFLSFFEYINKKVLDILIKSYIIKFKIIKILFYKKINEL